MHGVTNQHGQTFPQLEAPISSPTGTVKTRIRRQVLAFLLAVCVLSAHGVDSAESGPEVQDQGLDNLWLH